MDKTVNIVFSGTGGSGIITASDICSRSAMLSGYDVKKADMKGIAKRGGHVLSSVRFGGKVFSPKVEPGTADFLVHIKGEKILTHLLSGNGILINIPSDAIKKYGRHANLFALGILSSHLPFEEKIWIQVIQERFTDGVTAINTQAFLEGRNTCTAIKSAV